MATGAMLALLAALPVLGEACSNFYMNYTNPDFRISVRTMDYEDSLQWITYSFPRGRAFSGLGLNWTSRYGYVGFAAKSLDPVKPPKVPSFPVDAKDVIFEALNERGLSCGVLALVGSRYGPPGSDPSRNLPSPLFCKWAVENFEDVPSVQAALEGMTLYFQMDLHFVVQDREMRTIVVESPDGQKRVHVDANDGTTGFGIMTNGPRFEWQLLNVQHLEWKRGLARSSVAVPGNWYPDERFLRLHLVKSALEATREPKTYREAVAYATAVLNTVNVPMGEIPGTDSGAGSGEGGADHTQWAVVRDHRNVRFYLRSSTNPSLRLIDLAKMNFAAGQPVGAMEIEQDPWFLEVTGDFTHQSQLAI